MEGLDVQRLEALLFLFAGLIFVTLTALVLYVVVASRRRKRASLSRRQGGHAVEPWAEREVAGQVLALVREEPWSPLEVEIGGKRYSSFGEVEDPQTKQLIVQSALALIRFTGAVGDEVSAPAALEETYTWREDLRQDNRRELDRIQAQSPAEGEQQETKPDLVEERFLSMLEEMGQIHAPPTKPSLASSIQHTIRPKLPEADPAPSFVEEIESIIQRRVQLIPSLQGRGLHVQSGPGGSVRFAFDGQEYESVGDVPNLTAQQLIQDAIQEWDQTT
jgi:hypothetical protein